MGKLGKQHMKNCINRHEDSIAGGRLDAYITLGMYMAEVVLANEFGWGKKRLQQLEANVHALCKVEIVQGAEKWSDQYNNNLEYGFTNLRKRVEQIHGEGHCDWMSTIKWR